MYMKMINNLVKLAKDLDRRGLVVEANSIKCIIKRIAESTDPQTTAIEEAKKRI